MGKRETVKGDGNACRTGRGCKLLSDKGKAVLFTGLSTGNGDKVAAVSDGGCVGKAGLENAAVFFAGWAVFCMMDA